MTAKVGRKSVVLLFAGLVVAVAAFCGYQEVFRSGLDRLPDKPCDGATTREAAKEILPEARKADVSQRSVSENYIFFCNISTSSDSEVGGEARTVDYEKSSWSKYYETKERGREISFSRGGVSALSWPSDSSVYVLCTPPGRKPADARHTFALIVDAWVTGDIRVKGMDLRKALIDFSYGLVKHASGLAKCQERVNLPRQLPSLG